MSRKLEGKTALITGGSRGIGAAIAKRLAADGANVAITYTKGADAAASVVKGIERAGGKAIAIQADAADADAGGAEAHEERRPHHHDRLGRRGACRGARACALRGHEGSRKDIYSGAIQRGREPGHHGQ
jgi:NAD(P)-dependent dehydrogenase (short-subunit alcohol dehydrogenase family)